MTEPRPPLRTVHDMLKKLRATNRPKADLGDLERVLIAGRKRARKRKQAVEVAYLDEALAAVRGERALIKARRAALPRLHLWHEYRKKEAHDE
jgi:hypothetical protein